MWSVFRHLLLVALFLLAQAGALAHGVSHFSHHDDGVPGGEPVCEQCLAYAPLGAGAASSIPVWQAPATRVEFDSAPLADFLTGFRPTYQSRAPPLTC
jgi:hypothetical protein